MIKAGEAAMKRLEEHPEEREALEKSLKSVDTERKFREIQDAVNSALSRDRQAPDIEIIDTGKSVQESLEELTELHKVQIAQNWWTSVIAWGALAVAVASLIVSFCK